jgi:hypothetical protein
VVAALWALAGGPAGVTVPSLTLYGHYKSDTTKSFYDVTVGANGACGTSPEPNCDVAFGGSPNTLGAGLEDCYWVGESETVTANDSQCHAKPGFDGPSGIGTPSSLSLFRALTPTARITSPGTVTHGVTKTFSASSSTDPFPNGSISTYAWTWGDGSPLTSGRTPTHRYVKDNFGRQSPTVALTITVK